MKDKLQFFGVESREYCPFIREKSEDLLVKLLKEVKPKKILEIGTFLGYSASIMAEACPEAEIVTLEKSEINFSDAQKNLQGYSNIKSLCCDALDYLQNNQNVLFDFVFLDGPKGQYYKYLPLLKKMLNVGGVLFADDILFYGLVASNEKIEHKHRSLVNNLRKFIENLKSDTDFETQIFDFDDGVGIAKKLR